MDAPPHYVVYIALILAKTAILQHWKTKQSLNMNHWLNLLFDHMVMEQMAAVAIGRAWDPIWNCGHLLYIFLD